jgi:hypothetical protein
MTVSDNFMQPEVHVKPYYHHVSGRLRVRTTSVKRNASAAASVSALLSAARGVTSSEVNTVTGSILVNYDIRLTNATAICSLLDEHHRSTNTSMITAPQVAAPVREHIHRPEHRTVHLPIRRTVPRRALKDASTKILTFLLKMLLEKAIETAAKRSVLLLLAILF